jgi:hypothetical protein
MQDINVKQLYDFILVIYSMRKHYTKVEYFPKHILFITIYLLLDLDLNHNNKSMQETNMNNFVQDTEHVVYLYAKFEHIDLYKSL